MTMELPPDDEFGPVVEPQLQTVTPCRKRLALEELQHDLIQQVSCSWSFVDNVDISWQSQVSLLQYLSSCMPCRHSREKGLVQPRRKPVCCSKSCLPCFHATPSRSRHLEDSLSLLPAGCFFLLCVYFICFCVECFWPTRMCWPKWTL